MIESSFDNFELPAPLAALLQRILIIELCSQDFFSKNGPAAMFDLKK